MHFYPSPDYDTSTNSTVELGQNQYYVVALQIHCLPHFSLIPDILIGLSPFYNSTFELYRVMCHGLCNSTVELGRMMCHGLCNSTVELSQDLCRGL